MSNRELYTQSGYYCYDNLSEAYCTTSGLFWTKCDDHGLLLALLFDTLYTFFSTAPISCSPIDWPKL